MGCTILSDRRLVLILNPRELIEVATIEKDKLELKLPAFKMLKKENPISILVVDDSPMQRKSIKSILTRAGYLVDEAENGFESMKLVRIKKYSLFCIDLVMPLMDGFDTTYAKLGIEFDQNYYESQTYLLGKEAVSKGLEKGIFERQSDSSVWIDLTDKGLDRKLILRSDGTSVYMTQDIGLAMQRYDQYKFDQMVYVVGDEQNYHFQVLFAIMKAMNEPYADHLFHLSYGMVELPTGKMKALG